MLPDADRALERDLFQYLARFVTPHKLELFERVLQERTRWITVVLEDFRKSHNVGACLRSCDGFGVQDVHVVENEHRYEASPVVDRGSARWVTVHRYDEQSNPGVSDPTLDCLQTLKDHGYRLVATAPDADATELHEFDVDRPLALVFGTEETGISETVRRQADALLRIPMYGFVTSYNVSVACALCLQHFTRALRASELDWRLRPEERDALRLEWARRVLGDRRHAVERRFHAERRDEGRLSGA